jgi:hypothetical protein
MAGRWTYDLVDEVAAPSERGKYNRPGLLTLALHRALGGRVKRRYVWRIVRHSTVPCCIVAPPNHPDGLWEWAITEPCTRIKSMVTKVERDLRDIGSDLLVEPERFKRRLATDLKHLTAWHPSTMSKLKLRCDVCRETGFAGFGELTVAQRVEPIDLVACRACIQDLRKSAQLKKQDFCLPLKRRSGISELEDIITQILRHEETQDA